VLHYTVNMASISELLVLVNPQSLASKLYIERATPQLWPIKRQEPKPIETSTSNGYATSDHFPSLTHRTRLPYRSGATCITVLLLTGLFVPPQQNLHPTRKPAKANAPSLDRHPLHTQPDCHILRLPNNLQSPPQCAQVTSRERAWRSTSMVTLFTSTKPTVKT
jgi:hypothetical protein